MKENHKLIYFNLKLKKEIREELTAEVLQKMKAAEKNKRGKKFGRGRWKQNSGAGFYNGGPGLYEGGRNNYAASRANERPA